jgi:hypothetical protein
LRRFSPRNKECHSPDRRSGEEARIEAERAARQNPDGGGLMRGIDHQVFVLPHDERWRPQDQVTAFVEPSVALASTPRIDLGRGDRRGVDATHAAVFGHAHAEQHEIARHIFAIEVNQGLQNAERGVPSEIEDGASREPTASEAHPGLAPESRMCIVCASLAGREVG